MTTHPINHTKPDSVPKSVPRVRRKSVVREYTEAILVAVLLALLIRTFVVQAFKIPSGSMIPTLLVGDHILVNKFIYRFRDPARGDVIVFKFPLDESRDFIKRVMGLPGDDIYMKGRDIYVNCRPPEPSCHSLRDPWGYYEGQGFAMETFGPVHVPAGSYFMMGDNRNNSQDSRYWGFVKRDKIKGRAFLIYWSWNSEHDNLPLWQDVRWNRIGRVIR